MPKVKRTVADVKAGLEIQEAILPADVLRALHWLQQNSDRDVTLDALAAIAGVRPRTLEKHFKQFLGVTPFGWLRNARLAKARAQLLRSDRQTTVTQVALGAGFSQLGRFSGLYQQRFGELPSQTLGDARSAPKADVVDDEAIRLVWSAFFPAFDVAPASNAHALELLERAEELAPKFGVAKAMAAWCRAQRAAMAFGSTPGKDVAAATRLAGHALALAPNDTMVLTLSAGALTLAHRLEEADRLIERAISLDPGSAVAWLRRGWISAYLGEHDNALSQFRTALHLSPLEPIRHLAFIGIGCAHFGAGRHERAAIWIKNGIDASPSSFWAERVFIAALAVSGARAEASRAGRQLMRKEPHLTISNARTAWPFKAEFMDRLCRGLEAAGVPRG